MPFNTLSELFYTEHILSYIKYGSIDTFSSYTIIDQGQLSIRHEQIIKMGTFGRSFRRKLLISFNIYELCKYMANLWASAKYLGDFPADAERRDGSEGTAPSSARLSVSRSTGSLKKVRKTRWTEGLATLLNENIGDTESDILCVIAVCESWKIWMLISRICLKKPVMTFMESMHASLWRQVYPPTNVTSQILRLGPQRCTGPWDWDVSWSSVFSWMFSWLIWLLLSLISIHII